MHNGSQGEVFLALKSGRTRPVAAGSAFRSTSRSTTATCTRRTSSGTATAASRVARTRAPYPAPDLAVEVRSPSTWRFDIGRKKENYERYGVGELWLVDTAADVVFAFRRSTRRRPASTQASTSARARR